MARKYERFVISEPKMTKEYLYHGVPVDPFTFYMGKELVPEATAFADTFYRTHIPDPNPTCEMHAHPSPQILFYVGEEGTFDVEVPLEDEVYRITKTTAIWIPANVAHNVYYHRIDKPMVEIGVLLQGDYA